METGLQHAAENLLLKNIQTGLQNIRERVTLVVAKIRDLQTRNEQLLHRVEELEQKISELEKHHQISGWGNSNQTGSAIDVGEGLLYLTVDEREALERQIDDLLARVQSHLR
ncbi:MAG: hypothetical protein QHI48_01285 [Bacteroidota bacterium]|nr:hypothetical protein [Bacteroidota bacterium]